MHFLTLISSLLRSVREANAFSHMAWHSDYELSQRGLTREALTSAWLGSYARG